MKKITIAFFIWTISLTAHLYGQDTVPGTRPNVIIVLSDDQGYGDFSCLGNPVLKTPYIDKFYEESIRFDNFHVTPLCTPSRGELMTGLDALHNRASNVLTGRGLMRRDIVTMPEIFRANGYRTGIFGKWHLGDTYPDRPADRGFEKCVWFKGWGLLSEIEYDNDYYGPRYMDGPDIKLSKQYCTDLWFSEAIKWMNEMADEHQPFFVYLPLNAAHGPFLGPKKNTDEYRGKVEDEPTANFFGMISNIDENMQHLDEWLNNKKLKENTIVIYMTDNGGTGGIKVFNAGMRGQKASNYDGGHRAACFVRWPAGNLGVPRTISYVAGIQDWLPTFIDILGLKNKTRQSFDGKSLKKAFLHKGSLQEDRMMVVQYTGEAEQPDGTIMPKKYDGCVVYNNWRLVGDSELYDIKKDPGQQHNILSSNEGVYKKMKSFYDAWWRRISPGLEKILPVYVGDGQENPVIVNSNSWAGKGVNTQWGVALGNGPKRGAPVSLYVVSNGRYRIELSRWPFHLQRKLTEKGPSKAVAGSPIREGKELPIAAGCVIMNKGVPVVKNSTADATSISFDMDLQAGENSLQAWFKNKNGEDVCGAYYVKISKL